MNKKALQYVKEEEKMANKVEGYIKLNIPAGSANPSPPVGPALGRRGVNIMNSARRLMLRQIRWKRICQCQL